MSRYDSAIVPNLEGSGRHGTDATRVGMVFMLVRAIVIGYG
jgi:hypothetical protein